MVGLIGYFTYKHEGQYVHTIYSNFNVEPDGSCVEIEFQVEKHAGHPWRQSIIRNCATPGQAKHFGRHWRLTKKELKAWEERRVEVMAKLLEKKFTDHPEYGEQLVSTGDDLMVEGNDWHDTFWGVCTGRCRKKHAKPEGMNCLGELLMDLRTELREASA